ncbi:MAG TPA: TetR/AcrR family transcriptional regulator [Thermoanaerobaculia bacterium]|nr:TetR/AcrR family transcriptional regulator [Thermoanaerobaculia bacterium]
MSRKTKEEIVEEFRCASIQDAAMRVIARKGLDDATIQDIADEAGIAKGTLYVYFRDREELLAKTADRAFDSLVAELEPAFDGDAPFAERLGNVVLRQLRFYDENRALFQATLAIPQAALHKRRPGSYARYAARLEKLFADAQARGEIRSDIDPVTIAAIYRDCMRGMIIRRIEQKQTRTSRETDTETIVSVLVRGIASGEK